MKVQSVSVHLNGASQVNVVPHVDLRRVGREPPGAAIVDPANTGPRTTTTSDTRVFGVPVAYANRPAGPLRADPATPGLYRSESGRAYIREGNAAYAVRYDEGNATWRAYCVESPAKYAYAVRQDKHGDWRVHGEVGLAGGGGQDPSKAQIDGGARQIVQRRLQQLESQLQQVVTQIHVLSSRQFASAHERTLPLAELRQQWQEHNAEMRSLRDRCSDLQREINERRAELQLFGHDW